MPRVSLVDLTAEGNYDEAHDVFGYDLDAEDLADDVQYITVPNDEEDPTPSPPGDEFPVEIHVGVANHPECGEIKLRDTVELQSSGETPQNDGDFLRVVDIVENLETGEFKLRGYRMRRTKYLQPQFEGKLNELFMVWEVNPDDPRPHKEQALEDISLNQVFRKRECVLTTGTYPYLSFRHVMPKMPAYIRTTPDARQWLYDEGRLVCRWINKVYMNKGEATYTGEVRALYKSECDEQVVTPDRSVPPERHEQSLEFPENVNDRSRASATPSAQLSQLHINSDQDDIGSSATAAQRRRSSSVEVLNGPSLPHKAKRYIFGDCFCGAGGASRGAANAGLKCAWGADKDEIALQAFQENFPGASAMNIDIRDLPLLMTRLNFYVDILHLSCPCQFWSGAHTRPGKNDQENLEALYTVGPVIKTLKPRIVSLEQTPGLIRFRKHRLFWRFLIHELISEGYNVRYTVLNFAEFGLAQWRPRLLLIAARRGTPLPPFPQPTHGPAGSGLKPWVSMYDALSPLRQLHPGLSDAYHRPQGEKRLEKESYDPKRTMMQCITTGGGKENFYYDGTRRFTPREASCAQGFEVDFHLAGTKTQAMTQVGNAYPPIVAEQVLLLAAQTLEAFDHGLINADEEIGDLYETLRAKGVNLNNSPPTSSSALQFFEDFAPSSSSSSAAPQSDFFYLNRLQPSVKSKIKVPLFGSAPRVEARPDRKGKKKVNPGFDLYDGADDYEDWVWVEESPTPSSSSKRRKRIKHESQDAQQKKAENFWLQFGGKTIELD